MKTYICCAHAGGQGKTTVAQLIHIAAQRSELGLNLTAADFLDDTGMSKLGKFYPGRVEELGIGSGIGDARTQNDINASIKYWDVLGSKLMKGGNIIDMGANVITPVLEWAETRRAADVLPQRGAPPIVVALVCRAERRAIDDMGDLIAHFSDRSIFPTDRVMVVMNEAGGGFDRLDLKSAMASKTGNVPVDYIPLARCTSELWPLMEQESMSIEEALRLDPDGAVEKLGADIWSATTGVDDLHAWVDKFVDDLKSRQLV